MSESTSVYLYRDKHGILIYVGITKRGILRQAEHNQHAEWWPYVATQDVEHYETREIASARETFLIRQHRPPFNRAENPDYERQHAAYLTMFGPRTFIAELLQRRDTEVVDGSPCGGHCSSCSKGEPCDMLMDIPEEHQETCASCGKPSHKCLWTTAYDQGCLDTSDGDLSRGERYGSDRMWEQCRDASLADQLLHLVVDCPLPPNVGYFEVGHDDAWSALKDLDARIDECGLAALVDAVAARDPWAKVPF